jgi:hypothetical protein
MKSESLRRRNAFTAIALVLITLTFIPYVGEERILWMMWRDAPLVAVVMAGAAIALAIASRRVGAGAPANNES